MAYRTTVDGIEIEADTAIELRLAIEELRGLHRSDPAPAPGIQLAIDEDEDADPTPLTIVHPWGEALTGPQSIPVPHKQLQVLNTLMEFPDGITARGISSLIGVSPGAIGHRLGKLRERNLVQHIDNTWQWRATDTARRAKLVAS